MNFRDEIEKYKKQVPTTDKIDIPKDKLDQLIKLSIDNSGEIIYNRIKELIVEQYKIHQTSHISGYLKLNYEGYNKKFVQMWYEDDLRFNNAHWYNISWNNSEFDCKNPNHKNSFVVSCNIHSLEEFPKYGIKIDSFITCEDVEAYLIQYKDFLKTKSTPTSDFYQYSDDIRIVPAQAHNSYGYHISIKCYATQLFIKKGFWGEKKYSFEMNSYAKQLGEQLHGRGETEGISINPKIAVCSNCFDYSDNWIPQIKYLNSGENISIKGNGNNHFAKGGIIFQYSTNV